MYIRITRLEWMAEAVRLLKLSGFELSYVSQKTEASYYCLPQYPNLVLRVATHRSDNKRMGDIKTVSRLTFADDNLPKNKESFDKMLYQAVGRYFIVGVGKYAGT